MKKQSVLVQRALLLTAIVALVAVAVGLSVFLLFNRYLVKNDAQETVLSQARILAEAAAGADDVLEGEAAVFEQAGGMVWVSDQTGTRSLTSTEPALPDAAIDPIVSALDGYEYLGQTRVSSLSCALAVIPVRSADGSVESALVAALPLGSGAHALLCAVIGILAGLLAGAAACAALVRPVLLPVVRPLAELRDVAVSVADGDLAVRANERAPGEIGELGAAVNNVSTQLSRSMYTLILERNRLKHMIDGLSEGIVAIDDEGRVTHTNPALDRMFTKQKPDSHMPDLRMKFIPDKSIWEDFDKVIATREPMTRTLTVREMTVRLTITPIIDELGAVAGAVGLFSDITQIERLERTRREYVSNVNHELRTPLTAIRALVEPLKEGMVTSEADKQRYYDIILREVLRLSRLINDQLELSRLQSGTLSIEKSKITLDDLVYDVCDRYNAIAEEKGLKLQILTDFSECPAVCTNSDRVEQLLIILLDNAIKYTESGSVSVSASWDEEKVILSVHDTGIGIDEQDLPYVFDRFYKVDKAHSGKGSGLGLSIAKELLKNMNEEIWVTSEEGVGTEFSFTLHRPPKEAESPREDAQD